MQSHKLISCAMLSVVALLMQWVVPVQAANTYFNANPGYWTNPAHWSAGVPGSADDAFVGSSTTGGVTPAECILDTAGQQCYSLYVGHNSGNSGRLDFTGGYLTMNSLGIGIAAAGHSGTGIINVSGTASWNLANRPLILGNNSTGVGTVNLSAGSITNLYRIWCGNSGQGTINLSGTGVLGPVATDRSIVGYANGSIGIVNQSGGIWNNGGKNLQIGESLGSVGTVNFTGGVITNVGALYVGRAGHGTLNLSGSDVFGPFGTHSRIGSLAGGTGVVNQAGGLWDNGNYRVYVCSVAGAYAELNISGGTLTNVTILYNPFAGTGLLSITGSVASIHVAEYQETVTGSTLRVTPDSAGISPINVSGAITLKGTLEVDFSNYDSKDALTIISFGGNRTGTFVATKVLTEGWSAEVDYDTPNKVRLVNITRPPKGTLIAIR